MNALNDAAAYLHAHRDRAPTCGRSRCRVIGASQRRTMLHFPNLAWAVLSDAGLATLRRARGWAAPAAIALLEGRWDVRDDREHPLPRTVYGGDFQETWPSLRALAPGAVRELISLAYRGAAMVDPGEGAVKDGAGVCALLRGIGDGCAVDLVAEVVAIYGHRCTALAAGEAGAVVVSFDLASTGALFHLLCDFHDALVARAQTLADDVYRAACPRARDRVGRLLLLDACLRRGEFHPETWTWLDEIMPWNSLDPASDRMHGLRGLVCEIVGLGGGAWEACTPLAQTQLCEKVCGPHCPNIPAPPPRPQTPFRYGPADAAMANELLPRDQDPEYNPDEIDSDAADDDDEAAAPGWRVPGWLARRVLRDSLRIYQAGRTREWLGVVGFLQLVDGDELRLHGLSVRKFWVVWLLCGLSDVRFSTQGEAWATAFRPLCAKCIGRLEVVEADVAGPVAEAFRDAGVDFSDEISPCDGHRAFLWRVWFASGSHLLDSWDVSGAGAVPADVFPEAICTDVVYSFRACRSRCAMAQGTVYTGSFDVAGNRVNTRCAIIE